MHTSRSCASVCRSMRSISSRSVSAPGRSFLLPSTCSAQGDCAQLYSLTNVAPSVASAGALRTRRGMPARGLSFASAFLRRLCSSLRAISILLWSAASTTNLEVAAGKEAARIRLTLRWCRHIRRDRERGSSGKAHTQWRSLLCSIAPTCFESASAHPGPRAAGDARAIFRHTEW